MVVDEKRAVPQRVKARSGEKRGIWLEANAQAHEVRLVGALVGDHAGHLAVLALKTQDLLAKGELDAVAAEVLGHEVAKLLVKVARDAGGRHVDERYLAAVSLECLRQLDANVARANHGHAADGGVLELLDHCLRVLEELHALDVLEFYALDGRDDGQRTRGQDELVVGLVNARAVRRNGVDHLRVVVNALDARLHEDRCALGLETFLGLIEEAIRTRDLPTNPQRHAAPQKADVAILVDDYDLVAGVVVENGVGRRGPRVVGADDHDPAHVLPFPPADVPCGWTRGTQRAGEVQPPAVPWANVIFYITYFPSSTAGF